MKPQSIKMIKHIKSSQLKPLLKEYLASGDFSKPFVVAGWTATGKTTIISETIDEVFGKYSYCQATESLPELEVLEANNLWKGKTPCLIKVFLSEKEVFGKVKDYENFLTSTHSRPIIIEQTFHDGEFIKQLGQFSDVFVVDFNREEWLKRLDVVKGGFAYKLLCSLPDEMIHFGFAPSIDGSLRGHLKNSPRSWTEVAKHLDSLAAALCQLPVESRQAVIDALRDYCSN